MLAGVMLINTAGCWVVVLQLPRRCVKLRSHPGTCGDDFVPTAVVNDEELVAVAVRGNESATATARLDILDEGLRSRPLTISSDDRRPPELLSPPTAAPQLSLLTSECSRCCCCRTFSRFLPAVVAGSSRQMARRLRPRQQQQREAKIRLKLLRNLSPSMV